MNVEGGMCVGEAHFLKKEFITQKWVDNLLAFIASYQFLVLSFAFLQHPAFDEPETPYFSKGIVLFQVVRKSCGKNEGWEAGTTCLKQAGIGSTYCKLRVNKRRGKGTGRGIWRPFEFESTYQE